MLTLIHGAEIYAPEPLGQKSILLFGDRIGHIGDVDAATLQRLGVEYQIIDATDLVVTPGFIDPHVHLIGGGGEGGYATRTPEIMLSEIVLAGITTVIGCLGTDGVTRHMTSLLAKARGLEAEGISTWIYSGNYAIPTPTITGSVRSDIIIIDKILGAAEIAIADHRSSQPTQEDIEKLVAEARVGGLLSGKAGVTHFHVGAGSRKLAQLHTLLDRTELPASKIYATHITRSQELVDDAIALARRGAFVDITADEETPGWISYYREHGGPPDQLTVSSDGNGSLPRFDDQGKYLGLEAASVGVPRQQFTRTVLEEGVPLAEALPLFTSNVATVLNLSDKGRLQSGAHADVVLLRADTLDVVHVFARGRQMVRDGKVIVRGTFERE